MDELPARVVVGKNGAYWRVFEPDGVGVLEPMYSMCPVSADNESVEVIAVYEPPRTSFWNEITDVDDWLDCDVARAYSDQSLAQDWARVAKVAEETGEAIAELILSTGQNPRKGRDPDARERMLAELADVALTGILGIQHFTKDADETRLLIERRMARMWNRMSGD